MLRLIFLEYYNLNFVNQYYKNTMNSKLLAFVTIMHIMKQNSNSRLNLGQTNY